MLRITTLIENNLDDLNMLTNEHGLSLLIEFDEKNILFDTGQSDKFLDNAKKLKIDLSQVDCIVGSHGHYDHSGGVKSLSGLLFHKTPMYVGKQYFYKKYKQLEDGSFHYNGVTFDENDLLNTYIKVKKVTQDITELSEHILLHKNFSQSNDFERINNRFFIEENGEKIQDYFADELALSIETPLGLVVIVGCSHIGIVNIISEIKKRMNKPIYAVLGGTHLVGAPRERIKKTVEALKNLQVQNIAVSHCTGEDGTDALREDFKEHFIKNSTGNVYCVNKIEEQQSYDLALQFATRKHDGQFRKGGEPYITHPIAVANRIRQLGLGTDAQIAALFHDLLEDTDATENEIEQIGGQRVLKAVKLLTKERGYDMLDYICRIKEDEMAFAIKAADRLHNLTCMKAADEKFIQKYLRETKEWYYDFSPEIRELYATYTKQP